MASYNGSNTTGKKALDQFKMEAANEVGVDLTKTNLTAKEAGSVGGQMVKNLINKAKTTT